MSLFDGYKKKKAEQLEKNQRKQITVDTGAPIDISSTNDSEGYYFENPMELALYGRLFGKNKKVYWLSGDNYLTEFKKGYQLFEKGSYGKAIEVLKQCLVLNPIGISARFEICEAYIQMGQLAEAMRTLLEMKDFMIEDKNIARFYRRMGYIKIEEGDYKVAAACYIYSKKFENHPSIKDELMYIASKGGLDSFGAHPNDPEEVIAKVSLPIITKTSN